MFVFGLLMQISLADYFAYLHEYELVTHYYKLIIYKMSEVYLPDITVPVDWA